MSSEGRLDRKLPLDRFRRSSLDGRLHSIGGQYLVLVHKISTFPVYSSRKDEEHQVYPFDSGYPSH